MTDTTEQQTDERLSRGDVLHNRYTIRDHLGHGGFAVVYEGFDTTIERQVAIKVLDLHQSVGSRAQAQQVLDRFKREARLAARIRHPSIVEIYDFGVLEPGNHPYMVMEFLEGKDLEEELVQNGPIDAPRLLPLFCDALDALDEAHDEGVIHKDLKPANLFLTRPGTRKERLKLVDFGIAHANTPGEKRMTKTGLMSGTPQYLSPEYVERQEVTPAMDIYQMGLILIEALTGRPCVDETSPFQAAFKHVERDLDIPQALLKGEIGDVIGRALAYEPDDRFTRATNFADALAKVDPRTLPTFSAASPRPPGPLSPVADTDAFGGQDGDWNEGAFDQTLVGLGNEPTEDAEVVGGVECTAPTIADQPTPDSPDPKPSVHLRGPMRESYQGMAPGEKQTSQRAELDGTKTTSVDEDFSVDSRRNLLIPLTLVGVVAVAVAGLAALLLTADDEPEDSDGEAVAEHVEDEAEAEADTQPTDGATTASNEDDEAETEDDEKETTVTIELVTTPEGAVVKGDNDEAIGTTPLGLDLGSDETRTVTLHHDDYQSEELTVDAAGDDHLEVGLEERPASPPSSPDPSPTPQPTPEPEPVAPPEPTQEETPADDEPTKDQEEEVEEVEEEEERQLQFVP